MCLRQVLTLVVACGLVGIATIASATVLQTNDIQLDPYTYSMPSGTNLIQNGSSALSSQVNYSPSADIPIAQPSFAGLPGLNDGVIAAAHPSSYTQIVLMDGADGVANPLCYQVFVLNTAAAPNGYDISEVDSFASWTTGGNNSRTWQNMEIKYNLMGESYSGSGELLHSLYAYTPYRPNDAGWNTTKVSLTDSTGKLVSGISAIEFLYLANGQSGSGLGTGNLTSYSEVVAIGSPTVVPEPSSVVLVIAALLGMAAYAWRKRA
jgi:hypothetical protein